MKNRIAVFLGDFFWSSIPYDGLRLLDALREKFNCNLIMFFQDIRLKRKFDGEEKFYFDREEFKSRNPRCVATWGELEDISKDYDLILTSARFSPKATRFPHGIRDRMSCPIAVWDVGGADILTCGPHFATYYLLKGQKWQEWLPVVGVDPSMSYVVGCSHYDPYMDGHVGPQDALQFNEKYGLDEAKVKVLVTPTNPKSHQTQMEQNIQAFKQLCERDDVEILIKTYPGDYLYYERDDRYSGVYRRPIGRMPQYAYLQRTFPMIKVVESQDHFAAMKFCDKLFNISGSHISWESCFSGIESYAMNYVGKPWHNKIGALNDSVKFPDDLVNTHIRDVNQLMMIGGTPRRDDCRIYFEYTSSVGPTVDAVTKILDDRR